MAVNNESMDISNKVPQPLVAVIQMTSTHNKQANLTHCETLIKKAVGEGAEMIFLPECFDFIGRSRSETMQMAEPLDGTVITEYQRIASREKVWISLGGFHHLPSLPTDDDKGNRVYNSHVVINSTGGISAVYNKTHLFDVDIKDGVTLKETDYTIPGPDIKAPIQTPVGKVGLMICYDLRFPHISTLLTQQGAQILTYPSAFTKPTGAAHWEVLLRCRAIENQCYVIAAAQSGVHNEKRSSYGHSMVVDPWGRIVGDCGNDGDNMILTRIDLELVAKVRREMPVSSHRRDDLYTLSLTPTAAASTDSEWFEFAEHRIPSACVFYSTPLSYAFVNRKPVLPGHVLVAPRRGGAAALSDLSVCEVGDLFVTVQRVTGWLQRLHDTRSSTVSVQDGADAGQSVQHVHVHVLPRKPGDFTNNDDIYKHLEQHDKEGPGAGDVRSLEEMTREADELRRFIKQQQISGTS